MSSGTGGLSLPVDCPLLLDTFIKYSSAIPSRTGMKGDVPVACTPQLTPLSCLPSTKSKSDHSLQLLESAGEAISGIPQQRSACERGNVTREEKFSSTVLDLLFTSPSPSIMHRLCLWLLPRPAALLLARENGAENNSPHSILTM